MAGKYIRVTEGNGLTSDFPNKLDAVKVSSNIAIGILNKRLKRGYLCNYQAPSAACEPFIELAAMEAQKPSDLEVALVGNVPPDEETVRDFGERITFEETIEQSRSFHKELLATLRRKGITNIKDYIPNGPLDRIYEITVNTEIGEIIVLDKKQ